MSFSSTVKNELCRIENHEKCCTFAELAAVIRISGVIRVLEDGNINIRILTENAAFARKLYSIIKKLYNIYPEVVIRKSKKLKKHISYIIVIREWMGAAKILEGMGIPYDRVKQGADTGNFDYTVYNKNVFKKNCCKKAYLRGAFLAAGSISDPEKTYHLEITSHTKELAVELEKLVNSYQLNSKVIRRKGNFVTYLKEGEHIVDFLNVIGAHSALLDLENVRILKEMRNNVNRIVNCETANLEKTVNASIRQIDNIKYIKDHYGLENLPQGLKDVAELRLEYSDANLKELGEMLNPKLGKSGINHRLRKLDKIAEEIRSLKGEL